MIDVKNLTLKYPSGKGIFDIDFTVEKGEVTGYLGPNGAGKTTTIRTLMGFMQADKGSCAIDGNDCFKQAPQIQKKFGYIPGEIAFFSGTTGTEFLKFMADMRGVKDTTRQNQLVEMFEFDPKGSVKKFSKGMKQKLGIVAAFMHKPEVVILDEPTSGLDPLMQNRFVELVLEEKKKGTTMLMSSHMFEEVERTCNNILIIKDGRIVEKSDVQTLKEAQRKGFILKTTDVTNATQILQKAGFEVVNVAANTIEVFVAGNSIDKFIKAVAQFNISGMDVKAQTLEDVFMQFYSNKASTL